MSGKWNDAATDWASTSTDWNAASQGLLLESGDYTLTVEGGHILREGDMPAPDVVAVAVAVPTPTVVGVTYVSPQPIAVSVAVGFTAVDDSSRYLLLESGSYSLTVEGGRIRREGTGTGTLVTPATVPVIVTMGSIAAGGVLATNPPTIAVRAEVEPGLLDDNGNPILDENDDPILVDGVHILVVDVFTTTTIAVTVAVPTTVEPVLPATIAVAVTVPTPAQLVTIAAAGITVAVAVPAPNLVIGVPPAAIPVIVAVDTPALLPTLVPIVVAVAVSAPTIVYGVLAPDIAVVVAVPSVGIHTLLRVAEIAVVTALGVPTVTASADIALTVPVAVVTVVAAPSILATPDVATIVVVVAVPDPTIATFLQVVIFRIPTTEVRLTLSEPEMRRQGLRDPRWVARFGRRNEPLYSLLRIGGTYTQVRVPTVHQIQSASEYYGGGREHVITPTQRADLVAAGYGAYIYEVLV